VSVDVPQTQRTSSTVIAAAALAFANLTALMGELVAFVNYDAGASQGDDLWSMTDVWFRYAVALIVHGTLSGGILAAWPKARLAGLGVLLGTAGAAALLLVFVVVRG
jgi:hypothetical protein